MTLSVRSQNKHGLILLLKIPATGLVRRFLAPQERATIVVGSSHIEIGTPAGANGRADQVLQCRKIKGERACTSS